MKIEGKEYRTIWFDEQNQAVKIIDQVLKTIPGVYSREENSYGIFPNISLRGVDPGRSQKLTIMEDGVLSQPAPYTDFSAYFNPTTGNKIGRASCRERV